MQSYLEEVYSYNYSEKPFYSKLSHLLMVELLQYNQTPSCDLFYRSSQINTSLATGNDDNIQSPGYENTSLELNDDYSIECKVSNYMNFPPI